MNGGWTEDDRSLNEVVWESCASQMGVAIRLACTYWQVMGS